MARATRKQEQTGFEQKPWWAADALRNNMDVAEHKHVILGLIFLKYIRPNAHRLSVRRGQR